jgi:hypothetical protein
VILLFFSRRRRLGRRGLVIFCGHEVPFPAIHGEQICDHLPGYRKRRSIGIPFQLFGFIDQGQIMVITWTPRTTDTIFARVSSGDMKRLPLKDNAPG